MLVYNHCQMQGRGQDGGDWEHAKVQIYSFTVMEQINWSRNCIQRVDIDPHQMWNWISWGFGIFSGGFALDQIHPSFF